MQTIEFNHEWKMRLLNRFLTYAKIYSTSDPESETTPSTESNGKLQNTSSKNCKI
jgi:tripeptide aminopeptidase